MLSEDRAPNEQAWRPKGNGTRHRDARGRSKVTTGFPEPRGELRVLPQLRPFLGTSRLNHSETPSAWDEHLAERTRVLVTHVCPCGCWTWSAGPFGKGWGKYQAPWGHEVL